MVISEMRLPIVSPHRSGSRDSESELTRRYLRWTLACCLTLQFDLGQGPETSIGPKTAQP